MRRYSDPVEFSRVDVKLAAERAAAAPVVRQLRKAIDACWDREVPMEWQTVGFVQELTVAARDALKSDAKVTLTLAQYAVVIAGGLPPRAYPQAILVQTEAAVWKEIANAHRYRSEYDAALRAVDVADRLLATTPGLGHDRATMRLVRALVFSDQEQPERALPLLQECEADFLEYNDRTARAQCLLFRGVIEQRRGQLGTAIETYEHALDELDDDAPWIRAGLHNNLGQAYGELRNTDRALNSLRQALAVFERVHATGEVARTTWGVGRVLLAAERYAEAKATLSGARRSLRSVPMPEEAGLAGLDLADAFLATNNLRAAVMTVDEVVAEFRAANLSGRAMLALGYLSDLLPTPRARAAVQHVRSYLEDLRRSPEQVFLALPD
jgi:tetratricopeptide (TPR) repeat protein